MLTSLIREFLDTTELAKDKTSFWPSETETNVFDIYHRWIGTLPTNPLTPETRLMFNSAKLIEQAYVDMFADMNILLSSEESQLHIEIERFGIPVSGYIDALVELEGKDTVVEIKTYYGDYQERDLTNGKPRSSYLKQLAIYMDALDLQNGMLLYVDRGRGKTFQFPLLRDGLKFNCNDVSFDLSDTYLKWADLHQLCIEPGIEPPSDYKYKTPFAEIDWKKLSNSDISKARNNHKVIGAWQVLYSPYKDLIIEREGTQLGYTPAELEIIKQLTKNYTKW